MPNRTQPRVVDELLRIRALEALGPLGEPHARAALEAGAVLVEHDVLAWEGSHGPMHGHRVIVVLPGDAHAHARAQITDGHAAKDALCAALAAAMAERPGHAMAEVVIETGAVERMGAGPYRDPRTGGM